jgi:hypothetical protein
MKTRNGVVRRVVCAGALALLVAAPAVVSAQACLGVPSGAGQTTLSGSVGFPESAKTYGVTASHNFEGPVSVFGNYALTVPDTDLLKNVNTFGGGVAADLASVSKSLPAGLSACPTVSLQHLSTELSIFGETLKISNLSVPVGLGLGTTLPLGEGATTLTPYAIPQFIFSRSTAKVDGESESESDTYFGLSAGATLGFGSVFVGGGVAKLFEDESKAVFQVGVGLVF